MPLIDPPKATGTGSNAQLAMDNKSPEQNDAFWTHAASIDSARWNASFPYQLLLVKKNDTGYVADPDWIFTLPISPESISISMPFAINGTVTLTGYHEEHGGAPIRMISFSGTTGVMPLKGSAAIKITESLGDAIFGGTINNASRIKSAATDLRDDLTGSTTATNSLKEAELPDIIKASGYYQFRLLQQWFENYAAFKKTKAGRDHRMALAMWKDESIYLVTPQAFNVSRNAQSPLEYPYQMAFKAWRRVQLNGNAPAANAFAPVTRSPSKLGRLLKAIDDARRVLETLRDTISAVSGDLDHALFEPLRELCLFAKDLLGVPLSLIDIPIQIIRDAKYAIITAISLKQAASGISEAYNNGNAELTRQINEIAALGQNMSLTNTKNAMLAQQKQDKAIASAYAVTPDTTSPGNDPFNNPHASYPIFRMIQLGSVNFTPALTRAVLNERTRIRGLTRLDFEQRRDVLVQLAADFADAVGAGHTSYNSTFSRSNKTAARTPTNTDFQAMFAMNRVVMELNRLAASGEVDRFKISSINYMAGLASRAGIAFQVPKSKYAVPFMYGSTIEQMSTRYLGDPDRWIEIVALNGLRAPYVDEVGFNLPLLTNGRGNEIIVSDASHLFVGQQIWISSTTTARSIRHITKIKALTTSQATITVDGDADLERFSTLASASMHAFLPDTVNSMMSLYIPSDKEPGQEDYQTKAIPGIDQFNPLLEAGGFDLLLTEDGDLAITPDGDCLLAVGLQNVIQSARTRISVRQGDLNRHPQYGLPIRVGESTADMDAQTLLNAVKNLFRDDPSIQGVKAISVKKAGATTSIAMQLQVTGISEFVPVSFSLVKAPA